MTPPSGDQRGLPTPAPSVVSGRAPLPSIPTSQRSVVPRLPAKSVERTTKATWSPRGETCGSEMRCIDCMSTALKGWVWRAAPPEIGAGAGAAVSAVAQAARAAAAARQRPEDGRLGEWAAETACPRRARPEAKIDVCIPEPSADRSAAPGKVETRCVRYSRRTARCFFLAQPRRSGLPRPFAAPAEPATVVWFSSPRDLARGAACRVRALAGHAGRVAARAEHATDGLAGLDVRQLAQGVAAQRQLPLLQGLLHRFLLVGLRKDCLHQVGCAAVPAPSPGDRTGPRPDRATPLSLGAVRPTAPERLRSRSIRSAAAAERLRLPWT